MRAAGKLGKFARSRGSTLPTDGSSLGRRTTDGEHERRLYLVAQPAPQPRQSVSVLESWHLLSLDAPTVAALWTVFVAWAAGVPLHAVDPIAMFVAVWILYAADRLLDARSLIGDAQAADLEERHRFHHRHRRSFLRTLVPATLLLSVLLHHLAAPVLHLYAVLGALLAGWLLLVHAGGSANGAPRRLPKEFAVGFFFPAAVFIPTVARVPALQLKLLPDALLFAALCSLNCLLLYAWEHPLERDQAHASTRWALQRPRLLPWALFTCAAGYSVVLTAARRQSSPGMHLWAVPIAVTASMLLLLALHHLRQRLPALRLRALADAALLSPLPLMAMRWHARGH